MISINICGSERNLSEATESWLYEQILNRKRNRADVWIRVTAHNDRINIILTTENCPHSVSSSRPPKTEEKAIFDLWDSMGLSKKESDPAKLVQFLHKLSSKISD